MMLNLRNLLPLLVVNLLIYFPVLAQNSIEVVVEEFRIREGFAESTPSTSIVEGSEIQKKSAATVSEVLNSIPGLFVAQNGGTNQSTSVFIRGAESRHTLVLVDGMELNDPLNPSRGFDFSSLTTENIDRIEVFRGAQSVRFGSDAIGGVINIITKQGAGPRAGKVRLEAGSYDTLQASAEASGSKENINYSIGVSLISSAGFSAADKNLGNKESDSYRRATVSARAGKNFSADTNVNVSLRGTTMQTDLDAFGGPTGDDPNYTSDSRQFQGGIFLKSRAFDRSLAYRAELSAAYNIRSDDNPADPIQTAQSNDYFSSRATKAELVGDYVISDLHTLQMGLQLRNESGHSESVFNGVATNLTENSVYSNGIFAIYKFQPEIYHASFGLRQDTRSQYSSITSYSAEFGYLLQKDLNSKISYATGFKTPSLYQLYSSFGNSNLRDEKSNSLELAFEKSWGNDFNASLSIFVNQYYDLIDFDLVNNRYLNIAKSSSRGNEIQAKWKASRTVSLKGSFTHLTASNESNGFKLLRRPETTAFLEAIYDRGNWDVAADYSYVGERSDIDPVSFLRISMPSYDLINARFRYSVTKTIDTTFRVVNLFNRRYQSVAGFGTSELAFYAGLTKAF